MAAPVQPDAQYRQKLALVRSPKTPRTQAIPLLRHLFLEDLVAVSLIPGIAGDVRRLAEDLVINRLPGLSLGERIAMGRKASARVAGALILDREITVVEAALDNARLTEEMIVKALGYESISVDAVERVASHTRWAFAYNVRLALLRQPQTSLGRVLALATEVKRADLLDITGDTRMPPERRAYLLRTAEKSIKQQGVRKTVAI